MNNNPIGGNTGTTVKNYYQELADYLHRDVAIVKERCNYARIELAWNWETKKSVEDFYKSTDLYLFDLTMYAEHLQQRGTYYWFRNMIREKGIKSMVDFGGGIGEYSVIASEEGVKCIHYDFQGPLRDYANHRFGKHKTNVSFLTESLPIDDFPEADLYVCMDVFEHMPDPNPTIESISKKCKFMMCNPTEPPYNWVYPQHISRFTLPQFKLIERYLYEK